MMSEQQIIDLATVIGVYPICNTGAVLVHAIDECEEKVLASINGQDAVWCDLREEYRETSGEPELGFCLGSFFVPFSEVLRLNGGGT